jgi:Fic family protein
MSLEKLIRLGQASRKLNVGHNIILDFLSKKGYEIENNPNSKLTHEQYRLLTQAFKALELEVTIPVERIINIWEPIEFSENWLNSDTSILDDLAPSWFKKRVELKEGNEDYEEFIDRLKRHHAIETGVVEKLYDLSEGITQTFIKEGFLESYLSHEDTNIPPTQLMGFLKDHFQAMDAIFDLVKNERPLTIGFIKQLHQLITKNQEFVLAVNTLGQTVQIKLLKGEFKQTENNPKRADGSIFKYCPPIHVDTEMDRLIQIHNDLWIQKINPIVISAWVHHAFTQIHPFQDGNGRIARLLASLILIRGNLFPFTVKRDEKAKYIDALESADTKYPQDLVTLFCDIQKKNIEDALNYKEEKIESSFSDLAKLFSEKVEVLNSKRREQRQKRLEKNRLLIFDNIYQLLGDIQRELFQIIPIEKAKINIECSRPKDHNDYWFTNQITKYAKTHNYFFNKLLPRGWFKISFTIAQDKRYDLVISVHHYSYEDSVIAVGSFLEFIEEVTIEGNLTDEKTTIPINLKPYTVSLEAAPPSLKQNLEAYVRDITKLGLTIIVNEIS